MDETSPQPLEEMEDLKNEDLISGFSNLKTVLSENECFREYKTTIHEPYAIVVEKSGLSQIFISNEIYQKDSELRPYLEKITEEKTCIICVGKSDELNQLPESCNSPFVHRLGFPLTLTNLRVCLENLHKLQTVLSQTHIEKDLIAKASEEVKYVLSISRELNGIRDIPKLLNLILKKAREVTKADAGSIYTLDLQYGQNVQDGSLRFRFTQNDSIDQNLSEFVLPISDKSIVGNAVIHAKPINIPDLYKLTNDPETNPFGVSHDRSWDERIGYESHSMLTIPMFDISHTIIGVIQLINCKRSSETKLRAPKDFREQVIPFGEEHLEYAEIVAQQAGIALENAKMQADIRQLFDSFVNASVTAIELRDPTTSGHSHRVAKLTLRLAEVVNDSTSGNYGKIYFNADQMLEIKYASLLHDFGKLGVREHVLVKAKKLYPDEFRLIKERFSLIRSSIENEFLQKQVDFYKHPEKYPMDISPDDFLKDRERKLNELNTFYTFICKANEPTVLEQGGFELLRDIANCTFIDPVDGARPYLLSNELKALSVSRGSLTAEEFGEIQSHVTHTYEFLRTIPWGPKLGNVPQIAAKHHEKLDGSGYPTSAAAEDIPIQSRMMTVADIYDALTASDRPYKKAMPIERALDILKMEVNGGKLDQSLFDLFLEAEVYKVVLGE